ncbi:MAG: GNAT family N-acetyltransferase [Planctomycetes bacterium]|nr:GNAT family N-acetyltransferase [Planctomycetota bacterium]NUQ33313.1 GNAT family N-acetyltransferase [Planctomycetaceae bacterium]
MSISVTHVTTRAGLRAFIRLPFELYRDDPNWVPPLIADQKKTLSPSYPFFDHGKARLFLARKDGQPVGRISAQINETHLAIHQDQRGFFGWFESIEDKEVASALFDAAAGWLRTQNPALTHMRGPCQWDINGESLGVLIKDDMPGLPRALMPYNPPWYPKLYDACGLAKATDLYAYTVLSGPEPDARYRKLVEAIRRRAPEMCIRAVRTGKGYREDMETVRQLYNDAWADNWGALPLTEREMEVIAKGLKPVVNPELARIAFVGDKPAGCIVCIPDINPLLKRIKGRLFPFGWLTLLSGAKKLGEVRTILLGVSKEHRGRGLEALILDEIFNVGRSEGIARGEMSWVLETNQQMNSLAEKFGGVRYRTYRIYERMLT